MAKSAPEPVRPKPTPATTPSGPAREEAPGPSLPPLKVTYYLRMKRQRVYAVTASWYHPEKRRPPPGAGPVVLRLLMAGAQVVPSEQSLDPAKPDAKATFYVTPLARGWLRHECLEVLVGGRKVQEIPLAAKVTSQKMTLALFLLAIVLPWVLLAFFKYSTLQEDKQTLMKEALQARLVDQVKILDRTGGTVLENAIADNVPPLPAVVKDNVPVVQDGLDKSSEFIGNLYDRLCAWTKNHYLAYYTCISLLFLTVVSGWVHREKRKHRYGKPVPLASGQAGQPGEHDKFE